ncbi:patatin-like phospholipase family protein [candidate division KSB1 bacterium]|nr:patatin-like phospholipase family protein [candidate division KSB1 bacterium]
MLKRTFLGVLLTLCFFTSTQANVSDRPKIGLVLSGGGALGFAHIGTLKMLDSLEIPIDYIAGTSMGGILGALYSIGYDGLELENLVQSTDWIDLFRDHPPRNKLPYFEKKMAKRFQLVFSMEGIHPVPPSGLIFGQKVSLLFSSLTFPYEHIRYFDDLPIPFRCVAVDLVTGNEVVLNQGSLARAMRSTMAIPSVFSPVEWGDSLLVDGGIMNNLPVDVVRSMGADIVIAVDVGNRLRPKENLNSALKVLDQSINMLGIQKWKENIQQVDFLIHPELEELAMGDFMDEKIAQILHDGEVAARQAETELVMLKHALNLGNIRNPLKLTHYETHPQIFNLQITGHTTIPFSDLYDMLGIHPGDPCDPDVIHTRLVEMKASGQFESAGFDVIPISDKYVKLLIRVKERRRPQIHGITIDGNERIGFQFLYHCFGISPGDILDTEVLNRRIMKVYGLGYFETIRYDIEPIGENRVFLKIYVKELPYRKLRMGLWYDTFHKMVASIAFQRNDLLISGLRFDAEMQMAGLFQLKTKFYYPSQTLNLPVYPFTAARYRNAPVSIYDGDGNQVASYKDKSISMGAGVGLLLGNGFHADIALIQEHMFVEPKIAISDATLFPTWKERLREVRATATFDNLDCRLTPTDGLYAHFQYEGSFDELQTDVTYQWIHFFADLYHTFNNTHTVRMLNYWRESSSKLPVYKHYYNDDPEHLIGPDYHQVAMQGVSFIRLEYHYKLVESFYLRLIGNVTYRLQYIDDPHYPEVGQIWGYGIGLKMISLLGPVNIILSRGSKGAYETDHVQTNLFFSFGYRFF